MAKASKVKAKKKFKFNAQKSCLKTVISKYGFDKPVVTVSVTEDITGLPVKGLTKSNISVIAVQSPNGWAIKQKLKVSSVFNKTEGVYTFTLSEGGNDLKKGNWTITIKTMSFTGKTAFYGQDLVNFRMN